MKRSHLVVAGSGMVVAWLVAWLFVLPVLVSDAYAGRSFVPLLNRAITGQATHSIEYYQSLAQRATLLATIAAIAALATGVVVWHRRQALAGWWSRLVYLPASLTVSGVIASGAWIGFVSGLLEGVIVYGRFLILGEPAESPSAHVLWMAPLSASLMGGLAGALVAIVLRAWRKVSPALPVLTHYCEQRTSRFIPTRCLSCAWALGFSRRAWRPRKKPGLRGCAAGPSCGWVA